MNEADDGQRRFVERTRKDLEAGADVIVAGSAVFKGNPAGNVKTFLNIFQEFEQG